MLGGNSFLAITDVCVTMKQLWESLTVLVNKDSHILWVKYDSNSHRLDASLVKMDCESWGLQQKILQVVV